MNIDLSSLERRAKKEIFNPIISLLSFQPHCYGMEYVGVCALLKSAPIYMHDMYYHVPF